MAECSNCPEFKCNSELDVGGQIHIVLSTATNLFFSWELAN
jgi:hypothetical protein